MANNDVYDLIVIGGGPGGLSAGIYAMRAALKTVLIEKAVPGGQVAMSAEVENYLGFERIEGAEYVHTVFAGPFHESLGNIIGVIAVPHQVLSAQQHGKGGLFHIAFQRADAFPGVFI